MRPRHTFCKRQRGVAVITALLLTTLAITIVASLFWQQQVQVRSIENQRLQLQKQWVLRGALDWAALILREDAKHSSVDTLDEPWAVPLADTRLDQFVENGAADEVPDAALSGGISDAQARYNLTNLCPDGTINHAEVAVFARLLDSVKLDPELAEATAQAMAAMHTPVQANNSIQPVQPPAAGNEQEQAAANAFAMAQRAIREAAARNGSLPATQLTGLFNHPSDLLAVPGFSPTMLEKLKGLVIFLPRATPVNVNTAPAEVLAARIDGLTLSAANSLVQTRSQASFRDLADFKNRLPVKSYPAQNNEVSVTTNYFLIDGKVRIRRASLEAQTLIERSGSNTRQIWIREY
ncbi:MAG TPA: type II secretion system minor pseudopilin GspK [Gallionella sp.]